MDISNFIGVLHANGIRSGSGVPCSFFRPLVNAVAVDDALDYLPATSEGEAIAIAAGLCAGGRDAFAILQNSGLGNAINPMTSMLELFGIPVSLFVSLRGEPGLGDAPQHALMGSITESMLRLCGLETHTLEEASFATELQAARARLGATAWIVQKSTLRGGPEAPSREFRLDLQPYPLPDRCQYQATTRRESALEAILPLLNAPSLGAAVISTTGKLSRELFELDDREHARSNRFYMVGSMGCAAGFGLGVARTRDNPVVVLDGDGALLMKLGTLATIGGLAPRNLFHIVFDNAAHDTTGGQPTVSPSVDFAALALAAGYKHATTVDTPAGLVAGLERLLSTGGPGLIRMLVAKGARSNLGRPTLSPQQNYRRFRGFLTGANNET